MTVTLTETTREVTTRDILLRAAWYAEEFDHCKGQYVERDGRWQPVAFCLWGAIMQAEKDFGIEPGVGCAELYPDLPSACWNDAPERTKAEVVAKLREAAEAA
jgi:hypothetical protein